MQLTKIVATIGPSTLHADGIRQFIEDGVTVFRFNFKHNEPSWHNDGIALVNKVADELSVPVTTMIDLQGPSIRVNMPQDEISLAEGEKIYFGQDVFTDDHKGISLTHPHIIESLQEGQHILADDGTFEFTLKRESNQSYLISHTEGILKNHKNLNIPGAEFTFPVLVDRDFEGLKVASQSEVDYIALSFVRSAQDVRDLREEMKKYGINAHVISKIETKKALDHIDEIIAESDAIMIARGDLGVELPYEEVPYYQKMIIEKCLEGAKPVITATQMLNSMITSPQPTRAEVSDVANAIYDLTDAVMLSGETASGDYPYKAVTTMRKVCVFNEQKMTYDIRRRYELKIPDNEARICDMAYNLFISFAKGDVKNFAGFLVFTQSGRTARLISRYRSRPDVPIFAFTQSKEVRDRLALSFGVFPNLFEDISDAAAVGEDDIVRAIEYLKKTQKVVTGQSLIVLHGDVWAQEGGTSTVKLVTVR